MKKPCGEEGKENCTVQGFIFGIEFTLLLLLGYPSVSSNYFLLLTKLEGRSLS